MHAVSILNEYSILTFLFAHLVFLCDYRTQDMMRAIRLRQAL